MKRRNLFAILIVAALLLAVAPVLAQDTVELRITWYDDGNEGEVLRDLLDRFEEENPDITVVIDTVPYSSILEQLPVQLAAGEGPDIARVTDLGGLSEFYLDMRPYLEDPDYWEENLGSFLQWLRPEGDTEGIYGLQNQLTVTGPYINRTLFEQAEVAVPSDEGDVTWEEWAEAANAVAEALDIGFPMAMDRSGHRFAGPAVSYGAQYFDDNGYPYIAEDEGYRGFFELFVSWHEEGTMPLEIWALSTGYAGANEEFANSQVVLYMSGSWQVGQFNEQIGDAFDWEVIPNPCGEGGICSGMPGGAATVAIGDTEHPEEVVRVMEYLASEEVLSEFHARTLFVPAHAGVAGSDVAWDTELPQAQAALSMWAAQVLTLDQQAFDLQAYPYNRIVFDATRDRVTQVINGELTIDEAIGRVQQDIDNALAEVGITRE